MSTVLEQRHTLQEAWVAQLAMPLAVRSAVQLAVQLASNQFRFWGSREGLDAPTRW